MCMNSSTTVACTGFNLDTTSAFKCLEAVLMSKVEQEMLPFL